MKNFPVIKISLLFICGILLHPLLKINFVIFLTAGLFLFILLLFYFTRVRTKEIIISFCLLLIILLLGSFRALITNKDSLLSENLYKAKNLLVYGTVTWVELRRDAEIEFRIYADSVLFNSKVIGKDINLIGKIREEKIIVSDSIYKTISPGNYISILGTYSKGREIIEKKEINFIKR